MKVNCKSKKICIENKIIDVEHKNVLEQDIIVPDTYPDIMKVLNISSKNYVTSIEKRENSIIINGRMVYYILYKSVDNANKYRVIYSKVPYKFEVPLENFNDRINIQSIPKISSVMHSLPNERKLTIKTESVYNIIGTIVEEQEIMTAIEEGIDCQISPVERVINNIIQVKSNNFGTREEIVLKENKPDIYEIVATNATFKNVDFKVSYNKIIVKADLKGEIIYTTQKENEYFVKENFEIPITGFVEVDSIVPDAKIAVNMDIQNIDYTLNNANINSNSVIVDLESRINVKITKESTVKYIEDMYFTKHNEVSGVIQKNIDLFISNSNKEINIKQKVDNILNKDEEVVFLDLESINISKKSISNQEYLEGNAQFNILIKNLNNVENRKVDITFKENLEKVSEITSYNLSEIGYLVSGNGVELNIRLNVNCNTNEKVKAIIKDEIELEEILPNQYKSIVVYVGKEGENVWDIAKKYKTTVENVEKSNDLSEKILKENKKLLIIR